MRLNIELKVLMGKLQKAFPEIKEEKFKAVMFDLMMDIESGAVDTASISAPPRQEIRDLATNEVVETLPARQPHALVGDAVSWGDVGKVSKLADDTASFDFEADTNQQPPEPPRPPAKKGARLTREEKEARRKEADDFVGLTDLEIARKLTDQADSKQKKQNGQFTGLGGEGAPEDGDFVVG